MRQSRLTIEGIERGPSDGIGKLRPNFYQMIECRLPLPLSSFCLTSKGI